MSNIFEPTRIGFRWLTEADLPLMHRWLNQGEALRWYGLRLTTPEEIAEHYRPRLDGNDTTKSSLFTYDGEPVGYIQHYLAENEPEYWSRQQFPPGTAGIDLFIGEATFLHCGFGPLVIRRYLGECLFADPAITSCIIDPDPDNAVAIRAYEKAGFRYLRTLGPPEHVDRAYLMILTRKELERAPLQNLGEDGAR